MEDTVHAMWVHVDENPSNVPFVGWVTTVALSGRITPPPTGTSDALVRTSPPEPPEPLEPEPPLGE